MKKLSGFNARYIKAQVFFSIRHFFKNAPEKSLKHHAPAVNIMQQESNTGNASAKQLVSLGKPILRQWLWYEDQKTSNCALIASGMPSLNKL